jgi:hypothetical protein
VRKRVKCSRLFVQLFCAENHFARNSIKSFFKKKGTKNRFVAESGWQLLFQCKQKFTKTRKGWEMKSYNFILKVFMNFDFCNIL